MNWPRDITESPQIEMGASSEHGNVDNISPSPCQGPVAWNTVTFVNTDKILIAKSDVDIQVQRINESERKLDFIMTESE